MSALLLTPTYFFRCQNKSLMNDEMHVKNSFFTWKISATVDEAKVIKFVMFYTNTKFLTNATDNDVEYVNHFQNLKPLQCWLIFNNMMPLCCFNHIVYMFVLP